MQYQALVEEWPGECMAYFRELPGCLSAAPTCEEAIAAAPAAITAHLRWLKSNGLLDQVDRGIEVVVRERIAIGSEQKGPLFEADLAAPTDEEIDNALNVAAVARTDLIELYESVPHELRERSPRPGGWSMSEHMWHIIEAELWYISRLSDNAQVKTRADLPNDVSRALFDVAMDSELALRGLVPEQRERVFSHEGEEWTAAKVIRRLVGHLREHYPWIERISQELQGVR